jgi:sugar phosphate isomerase/epimerase
MRDACLDAGEYALARGVTIAIETGPEPMARLKEFVDSCGGGVGINYDPANLVMVTGDDEVQGVYTAGSSIVHTHAKDGCCNFHAGPEEVYALFAKGGIEALTRVQTYFTETPLGEGKVRWPEYLRALEDIGYDGYLTIEREVRENAREDIRIFMS